MADKESASYEASSQQQKQSTTIHLPSLTSKPLKHQQAMMKDQHDHQAESSAASPSGGYYLNVAQKGKLILPTALWILLIVAGVSFLTLLASLNRTLDTLDTLVESEQEKEAQQSRLNHLQHDLYDEHHEHHHHKAPNGNQRKHADSKYQELDGGVSDDNSGLMSALMLGPGSSSWFSLPSWVSLEPAAASSRLRGGDVAPTLSRASHSQHDHAPSQIDSLMDDMVRQMMGPSSNADGAPEISGSFIISSSPDGGDLQISGSGPLDGPMDQSAGSLMDSIFKQVLPMLDLGSTMGSNSRKRPQESEPPKRRDSIANNQQQQQQPAPSLITANIENLHVNLGSTGGGSDNNNNSNNSNNSNNNSDEPQVIISISSDEPGQMGYGNNPQAVRFPDLGSFIIGQPLDSQQAHSGHHHHSIRPSRRPGLGSSSGALLAGGQSPYELPIGSPLSSLIDSFRDFDQTMAGSNRNGQQQQQHSIKMSQPKDDMQKLKEDAKWDVLSNDLADSFLQSMLQLPQQMGLEGNQQEPSGQSIMLINGKPLADGERQKFLNSPLFPEGKSKITTSSDEQRKASTKSSSTDNEPSSIGDVINLLFGPEPGTSIKGAATTSKDIDQDRKEEGSAGEQVSMDQMLKEMKDTLEQSILAPVTIIKTDGDQNDSLPLQLGDASTSSADNQAAATSKGAQDSNDSLMNDLIGTMFTLPQFGDSSSQQDIGGSSSGGSSSGGSSSSSLDDLSGTSLEDLLTAAASMSDDSDDDNAHDNSNNDDANDVHSNEPMNLDAFQLFDGQSFASSQELSSSSDQDQPSKTVEYETLEQ